MVVKLLASVAVTGLLLSTTVGPTRAVAQGAGLESDSSFIAMAGSLALLQVKLGKLAQENGTSSAVRDFGKRMVADYSKTSEELAAGAKQAAYPSPVLLRQHKQLVDRFSHMGRSSFDKNYMTEAVNDHNEAVRLFQHEAETGRVASLKQLATSMLPTVKEHLELARGTAGVVGADLTATTSAERQGS
jgi:putative membrane protein